MKTAVVQIITAAIGTLGFSIYFRVSEKMFLLPHSAVLSDGAFICLSTKSAEFCFCQTL